MRRSFVKAGLGPVALLAALTLGGCNSTGSSEGGSTLSNLFFYGGTTVPPAAPANSIEVPDCPPVDVGEGGAALRAVAGRSAEAGSVRSQTSIANVARECSGRPDGSVVVKVGVEGRALAGPGGSVSRSEVPIFFVLKRGERILASRVRRAPITVGADGTQGSFIAIEDGLTVPPGIGGEFEIEVGLGNGPSGAAAPARTRRARSQG
jgi:hypothetical protein